ncbi:MAG: hypothetical protein GY807_16260 [Gammaproteobacteria bacterium]|nr:hypothetical protein [Gammaproteobacteria bacterium]
MRRACTGFRVILSLISLPIYCWWLNLTIPEAVITDTVISSFVVGYTYLFTLGYDRVFPVVPDCDSFADGQ